MKTIEQQVEDLMATLPYLTVSPGGVEGFRARLYLALQEVARDQRHACAEAINAVDCETGAIWKDRAHKIVMNTPEPGVTK